MCGNETDHHSFCNEVQQLFQSIYQPLRNKILPIATDVPNNCEEDETAKENGFYIYYVERK